MNKEDDGFDRRIVCRHFSLDFSVTMAELAINKARFVSQSRAFENINSRLIALWAFSEAGLGALLHLLKIPFSGLFVGSFAVLIITLIAYFHYRPGRIMRAVLIVLIIKGLVSPQAPVLSFLAVILQGFLGEVLFGLLPSKRIAAFILGFSALLLSAFQKVIVTTLMFGMNIWHSIDLFGNYVLSQFMISTHDPLTLPLSYSLVTLYILLHLLAGLLVGLSGPRLAERIQTEIEQNSESYRIPLPKMASTSGIEKISRPHRLKKISSYLIVALVVSILVLSYVFPIFPKNQGLAALLMLMRYTILAVIWYLFLGPVMMGRIRKYLSHKQSVYSSEVDHIIRFIPHMRYLANFSWKESLAGRKIGRIHRFIFFFIMHLLVLDFN